MQDLFQTRVFAAIDQAAVGSGGQAVLLKILFALADGNVQAALILPPGSDIIGPAERAGHTFWSGIIRRDLSSLSASAALVSQVCAATRLVRHLFHKDLPVVLYCNGPRTYVLGALARLALWRHVTLVWHVHSILTSHSTFYRILGRVVGARCLFVSNVAASAIGLPGQTVYNGVPVMSPRSAIFRKPETTFLILGQIARWKRIDLILRAFARMSAQVAPSRVVICGDVRIRTADSLAYKQELLNLCGDLHISEVTTWLDWQDDVQEVIESADVVVLGAADEAFSLVAAEGLMLERVVVCVEGSGPSEFIANGQNGFTFPPDDEESLASLLTVLATRTDAVARVAKNGRLTALSGLTNEQWLRRWAKAMTEILLDSKDKPNYMSASR